jgi:hypothetical protein
METVWRLRAVVRAAAAAEDTVSGGVAMREAPSERVKSMERMPGGMMKRVAAAHGSLFVASARCDGGAESSSSEMMIGSARVAVGGVGFMVSGRAGREMGESRRTRCVPNHISEAGGSVGVGWPALVIWVELGEGGGLVLPVLWSVMAVGGGWLAKGGRVRAVGCVELQKGARWPETPQRAQRTGSRQLSTKWSVARQRKQRGMRDGESFGYEVYLFIGRCGAVVERLTAPQLAFGGDRRAALKETMGGV